MKKKIENLLFTLSENAEFLHVTHEKFNGLQVNCKDGTLIKIYETLIPQELSLKILSYNNESSITLNSDKVMNFLDYSHLQIEFDQAYEFVEDFGQTIFNNLKENALKLLSGKTSELFSIKDEQDRQYNSFALALHNHLNNTNASIHINYAQKATSVNPLKVSVMSVVNYIENNQISHNYMHFYIPQHEIKNYPFIHLNILGHKDEATFIEDLILSHKQSKLVNYFSIKCDLEEKQTVSPKRKI